MDGYKEYYVIIKFLQKEQVSLSIFFFAFEIISQKNFGRIKGCYVIIAFCR
jgi:hypothetical protein